jgi:hypothetical protein
MKNLIISIIIVVVIVINIAIFVVVIIIIAVVVVKYLIIVFRMLRRYNNISFSHDLTSKPGHSTGHWVCYLRTLSVAHTIEHPVTGLINYIEGRDRGLI